MNVEALDHVNIITDRLDETAEFYGKLLGLERKDAPPPLTPQDRAPGCSMTQDRAIIHINSTDCIRTYDREVKPGALTGALHHVALKWKATRRSRRGSTGHGRRLPGEPGRARSTCGRSSRPTPTTCCSS